MLSHGMTLKRIPHATYSAVIIKNFEVLNNTLQKLVRRKRREMEAHDVIKGRNILQTFNWNFLDMDILL